METESELKATVTFSNHGLSSPLIIQHFGGFNFPFFPPQHMQMLTPPRPITVYAKPILAGMTVIEDSVGTFLFYENLHLGD